MPEEQFTLNDESQRLVEQAWSEATKGAEVTDARARAVMTIIVRDQLGLTRTDTLYDSVMEQLLAARGFSHKKIEHPEPRLTINAAEEEETVARGNISPAMAVLIALVFFVCGAGGAIAWNLKNSGNSEQNKLAESSDTDEPVDAETKPAPADESDDSDKLAPEPKDPAISVVSRTDTDNRLDDLLAGEMAFVKKLSPSEVKLLASTASSEPSVRVESALLLYADRVGAKAIEKGDFETLLKMFAHMEWIAKHAPAETFGGKDVLALDRYSRLMLAGRDPEDPSKAVDVGGILSDEEWTQAKTAIEKALTTSQ